MYQHMSQTEEPKYKILKPRQSILKAYLREPISETELTSFRTAMQTMLGRIDSSQHEEFNKNLVIDFFRHTRQTLWSAVQMLTQKLCCQTIHDCPKVVPLHYESE